MSARWNASPSPHPLLGVDADRASGAAGRFALIRSGRVIVLGFFVLGCCGESAPVQLGGECEEGAREDFTCAIVASGDTPSAPRYEVVMERLPASVCPEEEADGCWSDYLGVDVFQSAGTGTVLFRIGPQDLPSLCSQWMDRVVSVVGLDCPLPPDDRT